MKHLPRINLYLLAALTLGAARPAAAAEAPVADAPDVWDRAWAVALHVDPVTTLTRATPYGFGALSLSYAPVRWLSIDGAVGLGPVHNHGADFAPQLTLMPRARLLLGQSALALGAGISVGGYTSDVTGESSGPTVHYTPAWRANFEFSYEHRALYGFLIRPYLGVATILNRASGVCSEYCDSDPTFTAVYAGFSLGYAFE